MEKMTADEIMELLAHYLQVDEYALGNALQDLVAKYKRDREGVK